MKTKMLDRKAAEKIVAKDLGFSVRKTGSFLDFPNNKKPAYCFDRDGEYIRDAKSEAVKLWNYAVDMKAKEIPSGITLCETRRGERSLGDLLTRMKDVHPEGLPPSLRELRSAWLKAGCPGLNQE